MDKKHFVTIGKISNVKFGEGNIQIQVVSLSEYSINTSKISHKGIYNVWILTKDEENQKVDQNNKDDLCCKVKRQNKWYKVSNEGMENYLADLIYTLYKNQNIVKLTLREDSCNKNDESEVITAIELGVEYEKQL
ncbi:hypothetical protein [Bacillus smithii]|uniref:hypothetical protein n=1 Tax=Bacillus smithii TaxID=1479 RepID=UPI00065E6BD6|nr:hypothetical protein [Bacillus smithii]AKP48474.1 hypothetical protein BSM4216_3280 [Bacillus smithii]